MTHPEIELVSKGIFALYEKQKSYLAGKPAGYLAELLHRCDEERNHEDYSKRVAAEINRTACMKLMEGVNR